MKPRYTLDIPVTRGKEIDTINLSIPIRWDTQGQPTLYKNEQVPFAVVGKHHTRLGETHVARILTMHMFYPE